MNARVTHIMHEFRANDKSFREKETALELILRPFGRKFSEHEVREIWHQGIEVGVEIGLNKASVEGQKLELLNNTINPKHKEFLEKFYKLADEYSCAIQYHPQTGMIIIDKNINQ